MGGAVGTSAVFLHSLLPYGREGHWVSCGGAFNRKKERRGWGMAWYISMELLAPVCVRGTRYGCRQEAQVPQTADGWSQRHRAVHVQLPWDTFY